MQADSAIEAIRQELRQTKEGFDRSVEGITKEIKVMSAAVIS
jgi:hypothetical protein